MTIKAQTLAYLAGILDADGTIGIKKSTYAVRVTHEATQPTYSERIHIRQVTREALDLLSQTFGGNINIEDPSAKRGKPLFRWGFTDKKAMIVIYQLLPFLRIKHKQALNCSELRMLKEESLKKRIRKGRGHAGAAKRPVEISEAMEKCYQQAKRLNQVGRE